MQKDVIINVNGVSSKSEVQLDNNRPTGEHKESLEQKRKNLANELIEGRASDFAQYQKNVGIGEGLKLAINDIDDIFKKLNREDE